jgi:xanthine/CO dehydrogenase XdhC/CoxF family maturation factor
MDSALRPKDIQARIRAGESPQAVAELAQVPVERIMVYVVPVLAEREHIASLARAAAVRRRYAGVPSRLLGDAVDLQLTALDLDPELAGWDAWRRDDGRWTVTVDPGSGRTVGTYLFDVGGRYAVAADDAGRELIGDVPPTAAADADEMAIATAVSADVTTPAAESPAEPSPAEAPTQSEPDHAVAVASNDPDGDQLTLDDMSASEAPPARKRRERKRPSVPSWDEIVFGGGGGGGGGKTDG